MRAILTLVALAGFLVAFRADADTHKAVAQCQTIRDHDRRYLCLAEATGERAYCSQIRDHDLRAVCRANVG